MNKLFDLRFVIGSFFLIVGILLLGYSFLSADTTLNMHTTNRWCGIFFIIFGIVMIVLSLQKDADDELLEEEK
jgi:prolipoprotein diacylglyceryltransferase